MRTKWTLIAFVILSSIMIMNTLLSVDDSMYGVKAQQESSFTVWVKIYRIQKIDDIENPLEGSADWNYEIFVHDGDQFVSQEDAAPSNYDDILVDRNYQFNDIKTTYTTINIHLWDSDLGGAVTEDADISSRAGYTYYVCAYDLELDSIDTYVSDTFVSDGGYCKTSGDYDGSTGTDENDANLWFEIWDDYTPASEVPDPEIVSVTFDKTVIDRGDWVTVTVKARNNGDKADEMYISVSLPDNPPIDNVQIVTLDLQDAYKLPVGSEVWGDYGTTYPIVLEYPLVEGFKEYWETGETKTLQFKVKPQNLGVFRFFVKTTAQIIGEWSHDPQSGTKDQQNEYVYVHEINIQLGHMDLVEEYFPYFIFDEEEKYYPTNFFHDDIDITNNPSNYDDSWPYCIYVHTVETEDYLCIQYWSYYSRDDKTWGIEFPFIGAHDHDWESIYVYLEKQDDDYIPAFITYFRHAKVEGIEVVDYYATYAWGDSKAMKLKGTHPIVHVAQDSHASYEKTTYGYGVFVTPLPPHLILVAIEPCDDGIELDCDDFQIIYANEPGYWPDQFGTLKAPWVRERWNWGNPMFPYPVVKFSMLSLHETGSKLYLHVYDNQSRHVGFNNENSEVETEIPGSYYEDLGNATFLILSENITAFEIIVDATHAGEPVEGYEITLITVRESEFVDEETISRTIERGKQQEFDAKLNENGEIIQIPEFSSALMLVLLMMATLLAVVIYRRKHSM